LYKIIHFAGQTVLFEAVCVRALYFFQKLNFKRAFTQFFRCMSGIYSFAHAIQEAGPVRYLCFKNRGRSNGFLGCRHLM